jgi:hypothetical protein
VIVAVFFGYVLIHATRISRLTRTIESIAAAVDDLQQRTVP